jgi:hypothetical protein
MTTRAAGRTPPPRQRLKKQSIAADLPADVMARGRIDK